MGATDVNKIIVSFWQLCETICYRETEHKWGNPLGVQADRRHSENIRNFLNAILLHMFTLLCSLLRTINRHIFTDRANYFISLSMGPFSHSRVKILTMGTQCQPLIKTKNRVCQSSCYNHVVPFVEQNLKNCLWKVSVVVFSLVSLLLGCFKYCC